MIQVEACTQILHQHEFLPKIFRQQHPKHFGPFGSRGWVATMMPVLQVKHSLAPDMQHGLGLVL